MSGFRVFSIGDIPVFVSPIFLIIILLWTGQGDLATGLIWGAVVTFSILVHELGHALVARYYRLQPSILLHGMGGLCYHAPASRPRHEAFIVAAGPGAGLLLGALAFFVGDSVVGALSIDGPVAQQVLGSLLYVNIFWSFVNLLPMFPLDGGHLFRLLMHRFAKPERADKLTHGVGLAMAVLATAAGWFLFHSLFIAVMGLWLAMDNYRGLQQAGGGAAVAPSPNRDNAFARELTDRAQTAFDDGDLPEAIRLAQQVRAETHVPAKTMARVWTLLGVGTARLGKHEEALSYLRRAPVTAPTVEARVECLHMLDRAEDLQELVRSADFKKIGPERRREILAVLNGEA